MSVQRKMRIQELETELRRLKSEEAQEMDSNERFQKLPSKFETYDDIFCGVLTILTCSLAVDNHEVVMTAKVFEDLGAESIDFLDITYQLERCFHIKIHKGELSPGIVFLQPQNVENGKVTAQGLQVLHEKFPRADFTDFSENPMIFRFNDIYTVKFLCDFVADKLGIAIPQTASV